MSEVHQAFPEMATRDCESRDVDGSWSKEVIEMDSNYDVVIVGGGAAGLSGALVLGRARRRVVVIDAGAPRNAPAAHMQGFLSRDGLPPSELLAMGREEVARYGVELRPGLVTGARPAPGDPTRFEVELAAGDRLRARRLLVTSGIGDDLPEIAGASQRWGRDLLHCPYCHGWEVRDEAIGVIGWSPGSATYAQVVRQWSHDMVFFTHTYDLTGRERAELDARGVRVVDGEVAGLVVVDDRLRAVELTDGRTVERSAVFVRPRNVGRPGGLLHTLGCELGADGLPVVDSAGRTSVAGVWAAGNVVDPRGQVIAAAGSANTAAIDLHADLVADDVARAVEQRASGSPASTPEEVMS